jgi:hypothetical protein
MAKIGRPKAEIVVTESERVELIRLTKRARVNRAVAFRARVVLACADAPDSAVARRLRTTKTTVAKWRLRFIAGRLEGLYDEPRVGAPRIVSDEAVEAVIIKTLETTPKGETHWSTRTMAKAAGMSHTMVGRIWRTFGPATPHHAVVQTVARSAAGGQGAGCGRAVHAPASATSSARIIRLRCRVCPGGGEPLWRRVRSDIDGAGRATLISEPHVSLENACAAIDRLSA